MDSKEIKAFSRAATRAPKLKDRRTAVEVLCQLKLDVSTMLSSTDDPNGKETLEAVQEIIFHKLEEDTAASGNSISVSQSKLLNRLESACTLVKFYRSRTFSEKETANMVAAHRNINNLLAEISSIASDATSQSIDVSRNFK